MNRFSETTENAMITRGRIFPEFWLGCGCGHAVFGGRTKQEASAFGKKQGWTWTRAASWRCPSWTKRGNAKL